MRVTRWKVMAGGLLMSAGGLMAVADGPTPVPGCQPHPLPCLPAVTVPVPTITRVSLEAPVAPVIPAAKTEVAPPPIPAGSVPSTPLLTLPAIAPAPAQTPPVAATPEPTPPPVAAKPEPTPPPAPFIPTAAPAPAVPIEKPVPAPEKRPEPIPASSTAEKRLKVVLQMGDDRPRFDIRDGEEVYLKVVSDRVEVKSAADKNEHPTMKAAGKVAFVTPGGDGTCDELAILPGSGQVVAVGNVAFRHTWGRSETTVTAERMTFRLAHPGPTAIQAGYMPSR